MMEEGKTLPRRQKRQSKKNTEDCKDHYHASYTSDIVSDHLKTQVIFMRCGSDKEKSDTYQKNHYRFVCPSDESIEMISHPGSNIKEQEKPPRRYTQESQQINQQ